MNVLIIDDYKSHGESLAELVQVLGHEAQYAANYADARWLLELFPFEVALLDFDMPSMTGPTIAAELATSFPGIRSVIMSARPPDDARRATLRNWTFLQKPLSRQILQDLFSQVLRDKEGFGLLRRGSFPILKVDAQETSSLPDDDLSDSEPYTCEDDPPTSV